MFVLISKGGKEFFINENIIKMSEMWDRAFSSSFNISKTKRINTNLDEELLKILINILNIVPFNKIEVIQQLSKYKMLILWELKEVTDKFIISELNSYIDIAIAEKISEDYVSIYSKIKNDIEDISKKEINSFVDKLLGDFLLTKVNSNINSLHEYIDEKEIKITKIVDNLLETRFDTMKKIVEVKKEISILEHDVIFKTKLQIELEGINEEIFRLEDHYNELIDSTFVKEISSLFPYIEINYLRKKWLTFFVDFITYFVDLN